VSDSPTPPAERKGREGRKEILSYFASFALAKPKLVNHRRAKAGPLRSIV